MAGGEIRINLKRIRNNYKNMARSVSGARCAPVLKADAYGVGLKAVANALSPLAQEFFVAYPEEGRSLRKILPQAVIYVLHGFSPGKSHELADSRLTPVLNTEAQVQEWALHYPARGAAVHFDTGMRRLGLDPRAAFEKKLSDSLDLRLIMSHLACADVSDSQMNKRQLDLFLKIAAHYPGVPRSLAATDGVFLGPEYHLEMVRTGIGLYQGRGPASEKNFSGCYDAVEIVAYVQQVRWLNPGEGIGYGQIWEAPRPCFIATLGIGYADGLPRRNSGEAGFWIHGNYCPVVGQISMDSIMVDLGDLPETAISEGDEAVLLGDRQDLSILSRKLETIPYEILTSLSVRLPRKYSF